MLSRLLVFCAALTLCVAPVVAQGQLPLGGQTGDLILDTPGDAEFDIWWSQVGDDYEIHFVLSGASGQAFAVYGSSDEGYAYSPPDLFGVAPLDLTGSGEHIVKLRRWPGDPLYFTAVYRVGRNLVQIPGPLPIGNNLPCDSLDFDYTLGDDSVMVAGRQIAEQWADIGMHVSAVNAVPGKPDTTILFNSNQPSAHDPDLVCGEGKLLIIPENDIDVAPADGLVDVPDDAAFGGSMFFDFDKAYDIVRLKLVDFDEPGSQVKFFRGHDVVTPDVVIDIPPAPDGAVQMLFFNQPNVTRVEIALAGSGGVIGVCGVPCPRVINFDESPFGRPLGIPAGTVVTDQFLDSGLGMRVNVINGYVSGKPLQNHPDKAVLFDSDFPTGGDWDLWVNQGNVLIIAEDDFDVSPVDGLVDDPDDEAQGGMYRFDLGRNIVGFRATIVDVDEAVGVNEVRCYDEFGVEIGAPIPLIPGPDGNVQFVTAEFDSMRYLELYASGSASLAELRYCIRNVDE